MFNSCSTHVQLMFILFTPAFHLSHRRIFVKICDMFSAATHGYSWCQRAEQSPPPGMFFASRSGQSSADAVGWKNWRRSWSRCHGIKGPRKQLETWKFGEKPLYPGKSWKQVSIFWRWLNYSHTLPFWAFLGLDGFSSLPFIPLLVDFAGDPETR